MSHGSDEQPPMEGEYWRGNKKIDLDDPRNIDRLDPPDDHDEYDRSDVIADAPDDHPQQLDYSTKSGSSNGIAKEYDASTPKDGDGRGYETKFNPRDAPTHRRDFYEDLWEEHQKVNNPTQGRQADRRRDISAWASTLDLPDTATTHALHLVDIVDFSKYPTYSVEDILLAILAIAASRYSHPLYHVSAITYVDDTRPVLTAVDDDYMAILDATQTSLSDTHRVRERMRGLLDADD